jgi:hypothetical protein
MKSLDGEILGVTVGVVLHDRSTAASNSMVMSHNDNFPNVSGLRSSSGAAGLPTRVLGIELVRPLRMLYFVHKLGLSRARDLK